MQGFQEFLDVLMSFKPRPLELIEFLDYQFHVVDDFSGVPVLLQPPGVVQVPRRRSRELPSEGGEISEIRVAELGAAVINGGRAGDDDAGRGSPPGARKNRGRSSQETAAFLVRQLIVGLIVMLFLGTLYVHQMEGATQIS
mmetsp:Transcript_5964/g.23156  ORF Transcript_5964/g.23156 Transcript_5964/m.23156 type:complete len:141 (-) Transcript_5964:83-505(-)